MKLYTVTYFVDGVKALTEKVMLTFEQKALLELEKNVVIRG